jgi:hypothetical protein
LIGKVNKKKKRVSSVTADSREKKAKSEKGHTKKMAKKKQLK